MTKWNRHTVLRLRRKANAKYHARMREEEEAFWHGLTAQTGPSALTQSKPN